MFDALLKSKFYTKCKSTMKLTKTRIVMIRKKRDAMLKYLKNDMADLLKSGVDVNAYGRAEGLLVELNISSCYDLLEQYCLHILSHLTTMSKQRECPEDCREAVSTLMSAAARFSDVPELRELRAIFTERYGNSLDFFLNKEFITKLKSQPPTKEMKLQLLQAIAVESGVRWNSKALEHKLHKPLIPVQGFPNSHNDEEHKLRKKLDASAQRKEHQKAKLNHENAREHVTSKATREHHSSHGRKEVHGDVQSLPRGRESDKQKSDNVRRASNRYLDDTPPIKGIEADSIGRKGQQNEPAEIIRSVSEEESDDKKPFYYRSFQPNYNKSRACISKNSSDASPIGSTGEAQGYTEMTERAKDEDTCVNDTIKKLKPKSVRTRLQPTRGCEEDSGRLKGKEREKGFTSGVKEVARDGKHGIKIANGDHLDQRDEEEKMMDSLLMHYTRKQVQNDQLKTPKSVVKLSKVAQVETDGVSRQRFPASIPVELKQASPVALKEANSFEHDMLSPNGHIHPKLPDYDDFVTRLASLRGK
ncbi:uncharacterized protein LOC132040961 [Lycium ferocissimum]|uniref:uncharacterized protein LOC132040961 n=1 Tax=Lycium ferocissimum TaxID=112874 RepID=UPI002814C631|nr:uncharacterized protein LOC132040961 [Lycium ferocissimum]